MRGQDGRQRERDGAEGIEQHTVAEERRWRRRKRGEERRGEESRVEERRWEEEDKEEGKEGRLAVWRVITARVSACV